MSVRLACSRNRAMRRANELRPMTTIRSDALSEALSLSGFSGQNDVKKRGGLLRRALRRLFCDKRLNVSRPKLLLAITLMDASIVFAAGCVASALSPKHDWLSTRDLLAAGIVAFASVAALNGNWGYTIRALRGIAGQGEKILKSLIMVFCLIAGAGYLAQIEILTPAATLFWLSLSAVGMVGSRFPISNLLARLTRAQRLVRRTVIVGGGPDAEALIRKARSQRKCNTLMPRMLAWERAIII